MKFFDSSPAKNVSEVGPIDMFEYTSQPEVIELDDEEEEVTIGLLYDDLESCVTVDAAKDYVYEKFNTKRSWDEMKSSDLSEERNRILEELTLELDKSRASDISSTNSEHLVVCLEEEEEEDEP